jgi:hypothetical protein
MAKAKVSAKLTQATCESIMVLHVQWALIRADPPNIKVVPVA